MFKIRRESIVQGKLSRDEKTALAIVKSGRSYDESSRVTGITVERVMEIWSNFVVTESINNKN